MDVKEIRLTHIKSILAIVKDPAAQNGNKKQVAIAYLKELIEILEAR